MRRLTTKSGYVIWFEAEGNYFRFDNDGELVMRPVPSDFEDYAYTHGGALYQEAIDAILTSEERS